MTLPPSGLFDLTGSVAIVTGSSKGIGRAIAERMAQAGARVAISSRSLERCQQVADAINNAAGEERAAAFAASISSKPDLERLVEAVRDRWGAIDTLVCNAASNPYYGPMSGLADEQFRKIMDNNVLSNHWLAQLVRSDMVVRGGGTITIVSSIGGLRGSATIGAYNISKAADMQLARNLAVELGPQNIRVNCIAPGLIRTDFARALLEDERTLRFYTDSTALKRVGQPDEIAGAAIFLASAAGAFVSGQTIVVDGGATIWGV